MGLGVQVTFDCADVARMTSFWALALGYVEQPPPPGFDTWEDWLRETGVPEERWDEAGSLVDPEGRGPRLFFWKVPEGKTAKNRMHLDISAADPGLPPEERKGQVAAHVEELVANGAQVLREVDQFGQQWTVMSDPEGNEFCVQ